jgi:hypothetical protein
MGKKSFITLAPGANMTMEVHINQADPWQLIAGAISSNYFLCYWQWLKIS